MAKRTIWLGQAVLLGAAAWVGVGGARAAAQAGVEAGALGAASSSAASAAGKATGSALGSALGQAGKTVESTTAGAGGGEGTKAGTGSAGTTAAPARAPETLPVKFVTPADTEVDAGVVVEGPPPQIHFDVVSFARCNTPGSTKVDLPMDGDTVAYHCQPVFRIISFAYAGSTAPKLSGYPLWVENDLYNFEAKVAPEDVATWQKLSLSARRVALRGLLADALKLKIKADTTPRQVYLLSIGSGGTKLQDYTAGEEEKLPNGLALKGKDMGWVGRIAYFQGTSMGNLAESLSAHLDRMVLDRTGLAGAYDFALPMPNGTGTNANAALGEDMPSVAGALADLGLKLDVARAEVDGLLVVRIERPAEE